MRFRQVPQGLYWKALMRVDFTGRIKDRDQGYVSLFLVLLYISTWTLPWFHKLNSLHGYPGFCQQSSIDTGQDAETDCAHDAKHCAICQNHAYNLSCYLDSEVQCARGPEIRLAEIRWWNLFVSVWQCRKQQPRAPPVMYAPETQTGTC